MPKYELPPETTSNFLPEGYVLVTDPSHILLPEDGVIVRLSNDWRLVKDVNVSDAIGLRVDTLGDHIMHVATRIEAN